MITSLAIGHFKRFAEASFALRPLTVLTGLNGTGKSTVVQTLLLARQFADAPARKVVQLNGPYGLALGEAHEVQHPDAPDSVIGVRVECDGGRRVCDMRFTVPDEQALYLDASRTEDAPPDELSGDRSTFTYLCAERLGPRDQLDVSAEHPDLLGVGVRGEYTAQVLALHESRSVREELRHPDTAATHGVTVVRTQAEMWASDIIRPIEISAQWPPGITASTIRFREPGLLSEAIRPANMGFGFSYALPVIVAGLLSRPGDLLIVENPEAHLHPGGQSQLGRFLARVAGAGAQVIVETHSDHVLNGIRLAVAEDRTVAPEATLIHYFGAREAGSVPLELTATGELTDWPEGFFDQIERDLGRLARARRRGK
ncbi:DUF3696 domain-containing protein [Streptomyces californicus]|uniref:AAA family ATPase n=1 Tax=Streptomyces TaxID=1883 RepID=UPI001F37AB51|nr:MULTISPECIES: DUF3696 domain-containing protein [Streptomyces]MCF3170584.1 DUF3696 domain-containing protein [Streptomyces violaceoruber]MDW4896900.1 DUF3696 domain-containing protein [Streptomyces californicus]